MDAQAPEFDHKAPLYAEQLKKRLSTNVYNNGTWGWFSKYNFTESPVKDEVNFILEENVEIKPSYLSFEPNEDPIKLKQASISLPESY